MSARLSRQINYTERNKTWLFTRLSPTGPLSTHSSVVFDQCIREILVLGFHFRANVHNEYLLLICFRCFPELIQCFVLQHHYRLGFTTKCTTGENGTPTPGTLPASVFLSLSRCLSVFLWPSLSHTDTVHWSGDNYVSLQPAPSGLRIKLDFRDCFFCCCWSVALRPQKP